MLGAAAGFGTIGIFGELAASIGLDLPRLLPIRFALASVVVLGIARALGWPIPRDRRALAWMAALSAAYTGLTLFYFVSLRWLTAGLAVIVLFTYPAVVFALAAAFLDESVTPQKLLALVAVLAGIALVVDAEPDGAAPVGVALALAAAVCYALYTVGTRTVVADLEPEALLLGVLVGTTVGMTVYGLAAGGLALPRGSDEWAVVLGLTVIGTILPLLLFYEGVARLEAGRVGVVSTVEPLTTVVLGALLLAEPVTPTVVAGGVLVLGGVLLVQRDGNAEGPPDAPSA